jgi:hypothetical protein
VFGLILVTVMIFMPKGLLRGLEDLAVRVFKPSRDREEGEG